MNEQTLYPRWEISDIFLVMILNYIKALYG